jgi:hypothetical protein
MSQIAISFLLQLCLASLASAAPIMDETLSTTTVENTWQYASGGGVVGFIVLILDIIVFSKCYSFLTSRCKCAG